MDQLFFPFSSGGVRATLEDRAEETAFVIEDVCRFKVPAAMANCAANGCCCIWYIICWCCSCKAHSNIGPNVLHFKNTVKIVVRVMKQHVKMLLRIKYIILCSNISLRKLKTKLYTKL